MSLYLGERPAMTILYLVLMVVGLFGVARRLLGGASARQQSGGWLQDRVWKDMHSIDTGPGWMKGRFGTLLYILMAGIFFLIIIMAIIGRMVSGPPQQSNATENTTEQNRSTGAF